MDLNSQVEQWKANKQDSGFVLDFDGTLSPIVTEPTAAMILPAAVEILERLSAEYCLVAIVSGRQVLDVWNKVGLRGLRYFGLYGAEEWRDGRVIGEDQSPEWRVAANALASDAASFFEQEKLVGCTVELKDEAVSLHFRNALDPAAGEKLLRWAQAAAGRAGFLATMGRKVIDVRPPGVSKAWALASLVKELNLQRVVVAGDDTTDVEAMKVAGELLGPNAFRIGVRSGEEPPGLLGESDYTVHSSDELVAVLKSFL